MTTEGSPLRLTLREALLSGGLVAWGLSEALVLPSPTPVGVRVVFAVLATVPLVWRNRWPAAVMAWTLLVLTVHESLDVLSTEGVTPYQCVCLATYALAASERRGRWGGLAAMALVVVFPSFLYLMDTDGSFLAINAVGTALIQLTIVVAGSMVRTRRIEARRADARLQEEARSAPARLAAAVDAERRTIAAELQALVASDHAEIERLLGQARGALIDDDGVRAGSLAARVQETAARAVAEMRQLLRALGGEPDDGPARTDGAEVVARAERAQWRRDRAADVGVSLYRIVQEALTNARKHAPGASTTVRVGRGAAGTVVLVVHTATTVGGPPGPPTSLPGAGRGIAGMAERARLLGGTLTATPVAGGFEVEAELPTAGLAVVTPSRRQA